MTALLEQFISEARDFLQGIGEKLMQLEGAPDNGGLMNELFRLVHTLKGNSGLFDFPEMTRVLHAGEDLMDAVRDGHVAYSQSLADRLLDAMDFVGLLLDEIESTGGIAAEHAGWSSGLAGSLRELLGAPPAAPETAAEPGTGSADSPADLDALALGDIPEVIRQEYYLGTTGGEPLWSLKYTPDEGCFFSGDDPFYQARQTPGLIWGSVGAREPWPGLADLDAYRCLLDFHILSQATMAELNEYFRYMPEQVRIVQIPAIALALPQGEPDVGPVHEDFIASALGLLERSDLAGLERAVRSVLELSAPEMWFASAMRWLLLVLERDPGNRAAHRALIESVRTQVAPAWQTVSSAPMPSLAKDSSPPPSEAEVAADDGKAWRAIIEAQREILSLPDGDAWQAGRLSGVAATLAAGCRASGDGSALPGVEAALALALETGRAAPLRDWLENWSGSSAAEYKSVAPRDDIQPPAVAGTPQPPDSGGASEGDVKFGRRAEDAYTGPRTLKVDQAKVDHLMNLIGEMVVAKNSLPYLANRAEAQYGMRELAREIKAQHAVINRIAEEMQDAIMQVRMLPVSFVFQRFPRLVRDISRKLGKEVHLVLEGEETEADKNIIEALADPLIHIVRNSLDHGFEMPEARRAAGKPPEGRLTIRASQESDRVVIEIADDGKGIDPGVIKRKAYEKGLIDEAALDRLTDQEAVNLVFAAGLSTAEAISDLSGRGVGMDVVRSAVEKVNGTVALESQVGQGTRIRLSLPLSMAITNVMIVESDGQIFGVPMDAVVETVRVPRAAVRTIKQHRTTVLRGRIVPLLSLNDLLAVGAEQRLNEDDEFATLVVRIHGEHVGIVVDDFREAVDIILKPMAGILGALSGYAGSALLGDGSVLMVLNPRELV